MRQPVVAAVRIVEGDWRWSIVETVPESATWPRAMVSVAARFGRWSVGRGSCGSNWSRKWNIYLRLSPPPGGGGLGVLTTHLEDMSVVEILATTLSICVCQNCLCCELWSPVLIESTFGKDCKIMMHWKLNFILWIYTCLYNSTLRGRSESSAIVTPSRCSLLRA